MIVVFPDHTQLLILVIHADIPFWEMNKILTSKIAVFVFGSKLDVSENKYILNETSKPPVNKHTFSI